MKDQLQPMDFVALLELLGDENQGVRELARSLALPPSSIHNALRRLDKCGLYNARRKSVRRRAVLEFIEHAAKYIFPIEIGSEAEGIPTSHSAPPLQELIASSSQDRFVWPIKGGGSIGRAVQPIDSRVPSLAQKRPQLHAKLALVDAFRVGRARERNLAKNQLQEMLGLS